jgi:hypothetical protein
LRDSDWTRILGWPGYRVWRSEIDEAAKRLKLWVRRKRGNRGLICSGCGLRCDAEFGETEVCLSDPAPLLRYHLEPGFPAKSISQSCGINWVRRFATTWKSPRETARRSMFFMTSSPVRSGRRGARATIRCRRCRRLFSTTCWAVR